MLWGSLRDKQVTSFTLRHCITFDYISVSVASLVASHDSLTLPPATSGWHAWKYGFISFNKWFITFMQHNSSAVSPHCNISFFTWYHSTHIFRYNMVTGWTAITGGLHYSTEWHGTEWHILWHSVTLFSGTEQFLYLTLTKIGKKESNVA